jgi:hypothetical protein
MKTTEITTKSLIKRFHTLLGKHKISNDAKAGMLAAFGVESSTELDVAQLAELCDAIENMVDKEVHDLDLARKRLIASIFGWRKSMGAPATEMDLVKAIACRAAGVPEGYALCIRFNSIPGEKLRSLYNAFGKMSKDMGKVRELTQEMIDKLTTLN